MGVFADVNEVLVILKDHSSDEGADEFGNFDISNKFSVLEYEDGQPQSVIITLNCLGGRFLTKTPILRKRDRIYVAITDKNGNVTKDVFHIRNIKRERGRGKAISLTITCPHESENLWKSTVSYKKRGKRISGNRAIEIIVNDLNNNRGAKDPMIQIVPFNTVTKVGNSFDDNTANNYFFDAKKALTAIDEIKDIEKQPVEGGGSFEPMYVRFVSKYDHTTGSYLGVVYLQSFAQGYQDDGAGNFVNIPNITLTHPELETGIRPNILSLNTDEDPEEGTNLIAVGDKAAGSYPKDWAMYAGARYVFDSASAWRTSRDYKVGHLVNYAGITYECIRNHTSNNDSRPFNAVYWYERTFEKPDEWTSNNSYSSNLLVRHNLIAYKNLQNNNLNNEPGTSTTWIRVGYVPTVDYSPLTKNKAQYWTNALAGAKHARTNNGLTAMVDPNIIIDDPKHPRTYVRLVTSDPDDIPAEHLVNGKIPDGYKVLVINPTYTGKTGTGVEVGVGIWEGNDRFGLPFAGNVIQFNDPNFDGIGEWIVFKGKQTEQDQEVFDWEEGLPWTKKPCEGVASGLDANSACTLGERNALWVIGAYVLLELPGPGQIARFHTNAQFSCAHSVKWDEDNNMIDMGNEGISSIDNDDDSAVYIKSKPSIIFPETGTNTFYVGLNFWSLWPLTSNNIPFNGNVQAGEANCLPTLDLDNMDLTKKGTSEWFGPLCEEYFPFQAWAFMMNLTINDAIHGIFEITDGDFTIGFCGIDKQDTVMTLEFTHARNATTLFGQSDIAKLKGYKGVPGISGFFSAQQPNPTIAFDPTEFIMGMFYTKDSFDTQGRYKSFLSRFATKNEMKMSIDGYRIVKPLVCTNVDEPNNKPDVNIETLTIDKSSITNHAQLKNYVLGLEQFINFDRRSFSVEVINGKDVNFGDSVYLTDSESINDTDDTVPNTVKVVVNKKIITISKPNNGPGGLKTMVELIRRVWP